MMKQGLFGQLSVRSIQVGLVGLMLTGITMFESLSGQQDGKVSKSLPTPDDSAFVGYSDQMFDDQFLYEFCFWPLLKGLNEDSYNIQLEESFVNFRKAHGIPDSLPQVTVSTIATINSEYFRSEYRLVFARSYANMLGGGPPTTAMMVRPPGATSFFCLDTIAYITDRLSPRSGYNPDGSLWDPDNAFALEYVGNDASFEQEDSLNYLEIAFDAVTLSSREHPLIILNDIDEVYEFSNSIKDERFWFQMQGANRDTMITLLTSLRLSGIKGNSFLDGNYDTPFYDLAKFDEYADSVRAPSVTRRKDKPIEISLYTWSPSSGCLRAWKIEMIDNRHIHISQRPLTDLLGFYFMFG